MSNTTATFNMAALAASSAYSLGAPANLGSGWVALPDSSQFQNTNKSGGYYAQAWVNTSTGEVMIADRGSAVPINGGTDLVLGASFIPTGTVSDANNYAQDALLQAKNLLGLSDNATGITGIYFTGHSLGGYDSQEQTAFFTSIKGLGVLSDLLGTTNIPSITNISFNAPGIGWQSSDGNSSLYISYNLVSPGDLVNLGGFSHLASTITVTIPEGPNMLQTGGELAGGIALIHTGIGSIPGAGLLADGAYNTLQAHLMGGLLGYLSPSGLGLANIAQINNQNPNSATLNTLAGVTTTAAPIYDWGGYNQNGYDASGYNIYGRDVNGHLDPSIAANGGKTNTDNNLTTGINDSVVLAANGSAVETLNDGKGNTYTYSSNAAGQLVRATAQDGTGGLLNFAFDPNANVWNQSLTQNGQVLETGQEQLNSNGGLVNSTSTMFNSLGQSTLTQDEKLNSDGSIVYSSTGLDSSGGVLWGQSVVTQTNGQTTATISGQGALVDQSGINITLAPNAFATVTGTDNTISAGAGSALSVSGANTINTPAGTFTVAGDNQINISLNGNTVNLIQYADSNGQVALNKVITTNPNGTQSITVSDVSGQLLSQIITNPTTRISTQTNYPDSFNSNDQVIITSQNGVLISTRTISPTIDNNPNSPAYGQVVANTFDIVDKDGNGNVTATGERTINPVDGSSTDAVISSATADNPGGILTETTTSASGVTTADMSNVALNNLANNLQTFNDTYALLNAIRNHQPLPAVASGIILANDLTGNVPVNVLGTAGILSTLNSLYGLSQDLKNGNVSSATLAGANAFVQGVNAYVNVVYAGDGINAIADGLGPAIDAAKAIGDALPYLMIANDLIQHNTIGAVSDSVGLAVSIEIGSNGGPVGVFVAIALNLILTDIFSKDTPLPFGSATAQWDQASGTIVINAVGRSGGDAVVQGTLTSIEQTLATLVQQFNTNAPIDTQIGVIPERLGGLGFETTGSGSDFTVSTIDPSTGAELNPDLKFDSKTGYALYSNPRDPLYFQNLGSYYINNALARQAIAPEWEVQTAKIQDANHLSNAGLSELERAADLGHLASPVSAATEDWNPIALDLGGGLVTTSLASSNVQFNVDGTANLDATLNGTANPQYLHKTAWLNNQDGYLVLDKNLNGTIDNAEEMFSNSQVGEQYRGVASLATWDANGDGVIDATDPIFSHLGIWINTSGDGVIKSSEYHHLIDLGITSLNYSLGTYTKSDGSIHQMGTLTLQAQSTGNSYTPEPNGIQVTNTNGQTQLLVTQLADLSSIQANADALNVNENVSAVIQAHGNGSTVQGLLDNDHVNNAPNALLNILEVSNAQNGSVSYDAQAGTVTFTPNNNFYGTAGFDYTVDAGAYGQATAHVQVNVNQVDTGPKITDLEYTGMPIYGFQVIQTSYDMFGQAMNEVGQLLTPGVGYSSYGAAYFGGVKGGGTYQSQVVAQFPTVNGTLTASDSSFSGSSLTWSIVQQPHGGNVTLSSTTGNSISWNGDAVNLPAFSTDDAFVIQVTDPNGKYVRKTIDLHGILSVYPLPPGYSVGDPLYEMNGNIFSGMTIVSGLSPIVLDLNGTGLHISPVANSNIFFQQSGDGLKHQTAWFGGGNGVLAFDKYGDGIVHDSSQIAFKDYLPTAQTDLQGLAAFDSNHDGVIDKNDANWNKLGVWVDTNQDGICDAGEFKSLDSLGITSISLASNNQFSVNQGATIEGETTFTRTDGTIGQASDVILPYSNNVLASNIDGTTHIAQVAQANPLIPKMIGDGNNIVMGDLGDNLISAGNGNNVIATGAGNDIIQVGNGNNTIISGDGKDLVITGDGNNTIILGAGPKTVVTGKGNNLIVGGSGHNLIMAGQGNNTLYAGTDSSVLEAGNGDNSFIGGTGHNVLIAGNGNNSFTDGGGRADMYAGTGSNTFGVTNELDTITVTSTQGINSVKTTVNWTLGANQQVLWGTGTTVLTLKGNDLGDQLIGNGAADTLVGGAGSDTLADSGGAATLIGGAGGDTYIVTNAATVVVENTNAGNDTVKTNVSYTLPQNVEKLIATGSAALTLIGGSQDGVTLVANNANDILIAGTGIATLVGGNGSDTFVVNNTADVVQAQAGLTNINTIKTSVSYTASANVQKLIGTGAANITLTGNSLNDVIQGNVGNDTLIAGSGNTTLIDGTGTDTLIGGSGNDQYQLSNANDTVLLGSGFSQVNGGNGNITVTGNTSGSAFINLGTGNSQIDLSSNDNINLVTLGNGSNIIKAGNGANTINIGSGQDSITLGNGHNSVVTADTVGIVDTIKLGNGNNIISVGQGNDLITAGNGVNTVTGGSGNNTINLGSGTDSIASGDGSNSVTTVDTTGIVDTIQLGNGNNTILVGQGNDLITAGNGVNTITGGSGNNTINLGSGTDSIVSGDGNNRVTTAETAGIVDTTKLGNGNNQILVGQGNDFITVGNGTNTINGGNGADTLSLGAGSNTVTLGNGNDAVTTWDVTGSVNNITLGNGTDSVTSGNGANTVHLGSGQDAVSFGDGNNNITAADTAGVVDTLKLGNGNNQILVGQGNDLIVAGNGANTVIGGSGNSTVTLGSGTDNITLGNGNNSITTTDTTSIVDTLKLGNGNNQILVSQGSDLITTGNGANIINGGNGADTLSLGTGGNTVTLGNGNDAVTTLDVASSVNHITLGNGADTITGGNGANIINLGSGQDAVTLGDGNNSVTTADTVGITDNIKLGNGNNTVNAGQGNDLISAGNGANTITGGSGNNTVNLGSGTDSVTLGDGNNHITTADTAGIVDTIKLGNGSNTVSVGQGNDLVTAGNGANTVTGGSGNNTVTLGSGTDIITLGDGNNHITTADVAGIIDMFKLGNGNNTVSVGQGNDLITAGNGVNTITGGNGADTVSLGAGNNTVVLGNGNDQVTASNGNNTITTGNGNSQIQVGNGQNSLTVGNGNNSLTTGNGINALHVGIGNDVINNHGGTDTLYFSPTVVADTLNFSKNGADLLITEGITGGSVRIVGGWNNPTTGISQFIAGNGNYTVHFDNAAYNFVAGNGTDVLTGDSGNYTVALGDGNDSVNFGNGTDQVTLGNGNSLVRVGNGNDQITAGNGNNQIHFGHGTDTVTVGNGNNLIVQGDAECEDGDSEHRDSEHHDESDHRDHDVAPADGNAVIKAGDGKNTILVGNGNDQITAGNGNNQIYFGTGTDSVKVGNGNNLIVQGQYDSDDQDDDQDSEHYELDLAFGHDDHSEHEPVVGNDTITVGNGNNSIILGNGNNQVTTGTGTNAITVGTGTTTLTNHGGTDKLYLDTYLDAHDNDGVLNFTASGPDLLLSTRHGDTIARVVGGNTPTAGNTQFVVGDDNYRVNFDAANYQFIAGNGNNTIASGTGNDTITLGSGNNSVNLGNGNDIITTSITTSTDDHRDDYDDCGSNWINLGNGNDQVTVGNGNNAITLGNGNDVVRVGNGDNLISVGNGTDHISAGNGNDLIVTHGGNDTLILGTGRYEIQNIGSLDHDSIMLTAGAYNDLWFQKRGSDLVINALDSHEQITVDNWYKGEQLTSLTTSDGHTISATGINQLVQAMSAFNAPSAAQTSYSAKEQKALAPVLAANWH